MPRINYSPQSDLVPLAGFKLSSRRKAVKEPPPKLPESLNLLIQEAAKFRNIKLHLGDLADSVHGSDYAIRKEMVQKTNERLEQIATIAKKMDDRRSARAETKDIVSVPEGIKEIFYPLQRIAHDETGAMSVQQKGLAANISKHLTRLTSLLTNEAFLNDLGNYAAHDPRVLEKMRAAKVREDAGQIHR